MKGKQFVPLMALLMASLMLLCTPACAAQKLLAGAKVTLKQTAGTKSTEELMQQGFTISIGFKKRSKLTKSMTYSVVWLIPATVLANGNRILLDGALDLYNLEDLTCVGRVRAKSRYYVENKDGRIRIERETYIIKQKKWVRARLAGTASINKSGNYYELALKEVPFEPVYHPVDNPEKMLSLDLETLFLLGLELSISGGDGCTIRKGVSDYVFFDGLQVKAEKTLAATIRNFNYEWLEARKVGAAGCVPRILKDMG